MTLAVDGDIIAYKAAAVCEDMFELACDDLIDGMLKSIMTDTGIRKMRIYLTGKDNFREKVAVTQPYKGNRDGLRKPEHLQHCRDYLESNYKAIVIDGYEADDAIASDMVQNGAVHCGIDKDLYQIPGKHYNFVKKSSQHITKDNAELNLYRQILTGDSVDNIPGLKGVGEKTAEKIINNPVTACDDAWEYYKEKLDKDDFDFLKYWLEQTSLVTLNKNLNLIDFVGFEAKQKGLNL